ncbi:hypothetical protein BGP77_12115 [Saccharospirillum sp. MSK14-1]|nr:hypothetical protein BGP77_12115 [Saccharospirillum sp. MSK14-1]
MPDSTQPTERKHEIEPSFEFCWTLAWRLILLSLLIGALPFVLVNLCLGIVVTAFPAILSAIVLIAGNVLILIMALTVALKILLSKTHKNAYIRFYTEGV